MACWLGEGSLCSGPPHSGVTWVLRGHDAGTNLELVGHTPWMAACVVRVVTEST